MPPVSESEADGQRLTGSAFAEAVNPIDLVGGLRESLRCDLEGGFVATPIACVRERSAPTESLRLKRRGWAAAADSCDSRKLSTEWAVFADMDSVYSRLPISPDCMTFSTTDLSSNTGQGNPLIRPLALIYGAVESGTGQWMRAARTLSQMAPRLFVAAPASITPAPVAEDCAEQLVLPPGRANLVEALRAAFQLHPNHPWLAVSAELAALDESTLDYLLLKRDPDVAVTAFRRERGFDQGEADLRCALFEPTCRDWVASLKGDDKEEMLRQRLHPLGVHLLRMPNPAMFH